MNGSDNSEVELLNMYADSTTLKEKSIGSAR